MKRTLSLIVICLLTLTLFCSCRMSYDDENGGDNSNTGSGDNSGGNNDTGSGGNSGDNSGNAGGNTGSGSNTGDNSGNTGGNTGSGGNTGDNSGNTGGNTGSGDNTGNNAGDSNGDHSDDNSGNTGGNTGEGGGTTDDGKYTVTVVAGDGATVVSKNPVEIRKGYTAYFEIEIDKTYSFRSVSHGSYDSNTKILTVPDVRGNITVEFSCENVGYDTSVKYNYVFNGTGYDTSSHTNGQYYAGTSVTVTAGLQHRSFLGWTLGGQKSTANSFVSIDRSYTFEISPAMADSSGTISIYPNYVDANVMYYNLNGGMLNMNTTNAASNTYYSVTYEAALGLKITISKTYYDRVGCASLFWDDGTFSRKGYILKEYNTKPDGSGEGYSLGSKFPLNLGSTTLYCIWAKETDANDFEYTDVNIPLPSGVSASNAPHWQNSGVVITKYNGDDTDVVIPDKIGGKFVISIASNAFVNKDLQTLVMGRHLLKIEDNAFVGCTSLKRIYYPDGLYYVTNRSFDSESWSGVTDLYVNATIAPRHSNGGFALKFERLLVNSHKPRIIVIAGSSTFQGLSSAYLEALLDNEYAVINYGTTRTVQCYIYLEAMQYYANENDIILYAPENSIYLYGDPTLYYKTLCELEGIYNVFRHIDISGYENVLGAFAQFNSGLATDSNYPAYEPCSSPRYKLVPRRYEESVTRSDMNEYGEYKHSYRQNYASGMPTNVFKDVYEITLNEYVKSIKEGSYSTANPRVEDWQTSEKWCKITNPKFVNNLNRAIDAAKSSGAKVYFSFCPVDASKICPEAFEGDINLWISDYDNLIEELYNFDGILGPARNYIFHHEYFYDNAFHLNDYGRVWRTYRLYVDLANIFEIGSTKNFNSVGYNFEGCRFDAVVDGKPLYKVSWLE